jgi:hypothetical protein
MKKKMKNKFHDELDALRFEIRILKTYEEKLKRWAQFTVDYCDNVAINKINRSFYAFQSEPKHEPDILILGLNPQDMSEYRNQYENIGWGLKPYGKMIPEVFIHQNPWYIGGSQASKEKEWNILKNLNKTINVHPDVSRFFENMIYMNILYFNSKDFKEFKNSFKEHWKEVFENCVELSSILIYEVIKPKKIICLGIDNCYKSFIRNVSTNELIKNSLYKCEINGFDIYGMTHPSARTTNFSRENIGWHLYADWFNKPIINSIENKITVIHSILSDIASINNLELNFEKNKLGCKLGAFKFRIYKEKDISIYFEFQKNHYSDLRFELHQKGFMKEAKKCVSPYDNWITLQENFNQENFKDYFEGEIKTILFNFL